MRYFKMIRNLMAVGVSVCGLIACGNGDNSTMEVDPIADGSSSSVLLDVPSITSTSVVVDPQTGEEVHVTDTLDPEIVARIKDINEAGDTIWQYDTVFVPRDTLVRWVKACSHRSVRPGSGAWRT